MNNTTSSKVRIGEWIGEGWRMFAEQWKGWVGMMLGMFVAVVLPVVILVVIMYVSLVASAVSQANRPRPYPGAYSEPALPAILMVILLFAFAAILLPLTAFLMAGMYRAAFKQLRGGRIEFRDLFSARDAFLPVLGAFITMMILIMVGSVLCIIPGFIAAGLLYFTIPLIVDRRLGVFEALGASFELTKQNLLMFTLFAFLVQLIASVGAYACYVGLLVTYPLMFTIHAVAFRDCFGVPGARTFAPGYRAAPPAYGSYAPPQEPPRPEPPRQEFPRPELPRQELPRQELPRLEPPRPPACANCHSLLPPTATFCPQCGTPVR